MLSSAAPNPGQSQPQSNLKMSWELVAPAVNMNMKKRHPRGINKADGIMAPALSPQGLHRLYLNRCLAFRNKVYFLIKYFPR